MAESEQISWAYVKLENIAEIFSAWIDSTLNIKEYTSTLVTLGTLAFQPKVLHAYFILGFFPLPTCPFWK